MNTIDHNNILLARNKTKLQHKVYIYEGMKNIILANKFTVSQWLFGCGAMAIESMNKIKLPYISDNDRLILFNLRKAIKHIK